MNSRSISKILIIAVFLIVILNFLEPEKGQANYEKFNMTYLYFGTTSSHITFVDNTKGSLKVVSPSYFDINDDGSLKLTRLLNTNFIKEMHDRDIRVVPFLSNHWNRELGRKALSNKTSLVNEIVKAIKDYDLDGINIDIENLTEEDREEYTELVKLIRENLPQDKEVSVAVAANPYGFDKGWQGSYDYKNLAKYSDYLMVMTYDESYYGSTSGPIASIDFVEKSILSILKDVPSEKVVLGIPFYGRYWNESESIGGRGLHLTDVNTLINNFNGSVDFDEISKSPKATFSIEDNNKDYYILGRKLTPGKYTIWYENENSLKEKLNLVHKYDLLGTGSWSLGQEPPETWDYYSAWLNGEYFVDILNHWAKDYIVWAKENDYMFGVGNNHFNPDDSLTRAQGAATLVRILGLKDSGEDTINFEDVSENHWSYEEIRIAKQHDIIMGIDSNNFAPNRPITREEMAVMINRVVEFNKEGTGEVPEFKDVNNDIWSYEAIITNGSNGIFVGYEDDTFRPKNVIKRGEMATIINRVVNFK